MKNGIEHWVTEPEDEDSRETREVYALAGLALYCAQCLEHEIVNTLAMIAVLKRSRQASRPRATPEYDKYIDNIWDEGFRKTLGALIVSLRNSGLRVPADLQGDLGRSLDQRNRLVHSFFRERAESWFQPDGRRAMAEELGQMREQFRKTDRALHEVTESLRKARGIPDSVVERYIELRKQGVGEDEAMDIALREAGQRARK